MEKNQNGGKAVFYYDQMLDRASNTVRIYQQDGAQTPKLIAKGFYKDDFHLSITNQWATGDSTIVKQVVDAAAGIITGRTGKFYGDLAEKAVDATGIGSKQIPYADSGYTVDRALADMKQAQNSAFFTADDFFKSFKGTTVTFPSNISVTLLSDEWEPTSDIYSKLKSILKVSVGGYSEIGTKGFSFVGVQAAPNGFASGSYNLQDDIKGSLKVIYGDPLKGGYVVKHMLVSNVHFTFSKTKVEVSKDTYRPLYIDCQIMLEPAKKFTRDEIYQTIGNGFDKVESSVDIESKIVPEGASKDESNKIKEEQKVASELNMTLGMSLASNNPADFPKPDADLPPIKTR